MRVLIHILILVLFVGCSQDETATKGTRFLTKIADGIYVHHGEHLDIDVGYHGDICNVSVIVGSKGVAVIDTAGSAKVGKQFREAISALTDKPVLYVINTHEHPDHIFGNTAFASDKPQYVGHAKLKPTMLVREEAYQTLNKKYLGPDAQGSDIVVPTIMVEDEMVLDLGDRKLTLNAFPPAHSNADMTIMDSKTDTLFTGDLLFIERTPVVDGDIKGLIAALDKLKTLPAQRVVPGHGHVTEQWQQAIDNELHYLNLLYSDIKTAIDNDVSLEETMATAAASEKDKWVLFEIANRRNVNLIYPALEWE